jgi:uncharacterized protein (DUF169 family)
MVAVSFLDSPPEGLEERAERDKYCYFLGLARTEGPFYIPAENIDCPLARYHLALGPADFESLPDTLVDWGDAADRGAALRFLRSGARLARAYEYIAFFGCGQANFDPDLVVRVCTVEQGYLAARAHTAATGQRINASISGVGAACGECTAYVLVNEAPTVSLGCGGSRPRIGMEEGELLLAAPFGSRLQEMLMRGT